MTEMMRKIRWATYWRLFRELKASFVELFILAILLRYELSLSLIVAPVSTQASFTRLEC